MVIEMDRWDEMQRRAGGGNPPSPLSQEGRVKKKIAPITEEFLNIVDDFMEEHRLTREQLCFFMAEFIDDTFEGEGEIESQINKIIEEAIKRMEG